MLIVSAEKMTQASESSAAFTVHHDPPQDLVNTIADLLHSAAKAARSASSVHAGKGCQKGFGTNVQNFCNIDLTLSNLIGIASKDDMEVLQLGGKIQRHSEWHQPLAQPWETTNSSI
jgi:hypothetical protein